MAFVSSESIFGMICVSEGDAAFQRLMSLLATTESAPVKICFASANPLLSGVAPPALPMTMLQIVSWASTIMYPDVPAEVAISQLYASHGHQIPFWQMIWLQESELLAAAISAADYFDAGMEQCCSKLWGAHDSVAWPALMRLEIALRRRVFQLHPRARDPVYALPRRCSVGDALTLARACVCGRGSLDVSTCSSAMEDTGKLLTDRGDLSLRIALSPALHLKGALVRALEHAGHLVSRLHITVDCDARGCIPDAGNDFLLPTDDCLERVMRQQIKHLTEITRFADYTLELKNFFPGTPSTVEAALIQELSHTGRLRGVVARFPEGQNTHHKVPRYIRPVLVAISAVASLRRLELVFGYEYDDPEDGDHGPITVDASGLTFACAATCIHLVVHNVVSDAWGDFERLETLSFTCGQMRACRWSSSGGEPSAWIRTSFHDTAVPEDDRAGCFGQVSEMIQKSSGTLQSIQLSADSCDALRSAFGVRLPDPRPHELEHLSETYKPSVGTHMFRHRSRVFAGAEKRSGGVTRRGALRRRRCHRQDHRGDGRVSGICATVKCDSCSLDHRRGDASRHRRKHTIIFARFTRTDIDVDASCSGRDGARGSVADSIWEPGVGGKCASACHLRYGPVNGMTVTSEMDRERRTLETAQHAHGALARNALASVSSVTPHRTIYETFVPAGPRPMPPVPPLPNTTHYQSHATRTGHWLRGPNHSTPRIQGADRLCRRVPSHAWRWHTKPQGSGRPDVIYEPTRMHER